MPARAGLELARTSVFLDFDGTITTEDVGLHVLERFAPDAWRAIAERFDRGLVGSRECLLDEWDLVEPDETRMRAVAAEVPVDPGFVPLVEALSAAGADVAVVSDGFGFYVHDVLARLALEIPVFTNVVDWETGRLEFPHEDRCCPCTSCGVCKQAPIKQAARAGRTTVLVGDGTSDRKAALLADVVFAKGPLARWCAGAGVRHVGFERLAEVHAALVGVDGE
jgi:2-hydroxy-3-keto-5-methylthiopentenyl-1-phosphate phosphatase